MVLFMNEHTCFYKTKRLKEFNDIAGEIHQCNYIIRLSLV